jgi:hypothetical protein
MTCFLQIDRASGLQLGRSRNKVAVGAFVFIFLLIVDWSDKNARHKLLTKLQVRYLLDHVN